MTTETRRQDTRERHARLRAAIVALAPTVLVAGLLYHPFIADLNDKTTVVAALTAGTTRWWIAHFMIGLGSGLLILAFLGLRSYLREAGEDRWSLLALPFIIAGSTLFTFLPALEFAPLVAYESGLDPLAVQLAFDRWFPQLFLTSAALFAFGTIGFAVGIARSGVLSPRLTRLIVVAFVVMAVRFIPSIAMLYVNGVATLVAFWPLAYVMWRHAAPQPSRNPRPMPVT